MKLAYTPICVEVAKVGSDEWYFFSRRERKYATGWRRNRASKQGYWKATGKDKPILHPTVAGARKTLVFYSGRAPNGRKTAWVMHEFRLLHHHHHPNPNVITPNYIIYICIIYVAN